MDELTERAAQIVPAEDLRPELFTDFLTWIDRSQKTTGSYLNNLKQFAAWLQYTGTKRPKRQDVILYRQYLAKEHDAIRLSPGTAAGWTYRTDETGTPIKMKCKPNTVAQYMRSVCQFFRWTEASGLYPNVAANIHAPKVSRDHHRRDFLTPGQVRAIEESIEETAQERTAAAAEAEKDPAGRIERSTEQGKRLYAMYELAVNAGLRCIELSRANIQDFETKGGQAYLYVWGKGHTEADAKKPLAPEVAAAITDYLNYRTVNKTGAAPLFVATGNRSGGKRIAPSTISKMLKRAFINAGYNSGKLTAHSLRHSTAMGVLTLTGNNLYESQKYLRHENPATTEIYLHETAQQEQQQAELAERLYSFFHNQGATAENSETKKRLEEMIERMSPEQLKNLEAVAAAFAK